MRSSWQIKPRRFETPEFAGSTSQLDSLRAERVDAIARRPGSFGRIEAGLEAAEVVGFDPIKINVVLIGGQNDDEIEDFALLTRDRP